MRKLTLKRLKTDCDKLWRAIIHYRDPYCKLCGRIGEQVHHLLTRQKHGHLRFDLNNGVTLCGKCHLLLHLDPFPAHTRLHAVLGPERIGKLMTAAKAKRKPFTRAEIVTLRSTLAYIATQHHRDEKSAAGANREESNG